MNYHALIVLASPFLLGIPLASLWYGVAHATWKLTGWNGLFPADVWHNSQRR